MAKSTPAVDQSASGPVRIFASYKAVGSFARAIYLLYPDGQCMTITWDSKQDLYTYLGPVNASNSKQTAVMLESFEIVREGSSVRVIQPPYAEVLQEETGIPTEKNSPKLGEPKPKVEKTIKRRKAAGSGCTEHPTYKGLRKPRTECVKCLALYKSLHPEG